jgi:hypothetical protein
MKIRFKQIALLLLLFSCSQTASAWRHLPLNTHNLIDMYNKNTLLSNAHIQAKKKKYIKMLNFSIEECIEDFGGSERKINLITHMGTLSISSFFVACFSALSFLHTEEPKLFVSVIATGIATGLMGYLTLMDFFSYRKYLKSNQEELNQLKKIKDALIMLHDSRPEPEDSLR